MPGYAPVALITVPPTPALTGTTLSVKADFGGGSEGAVGDRYPAPPWVGLVWPNQQIPELGVNAEQITVTDIVGDEVTFERGALPIHITAGLQLAALKVVPTYNLGDKVLLSGKFAVPNPPYDVTVQTPGGVVTAYGPLDGVTDDGAGLVHFQFEPGQPGEWSYRFTDADGKPLADRAFFVKFSDVAFVPTAPVASPVEVVYVATGWQGNWDSGTAYLQGDIVVDLEVVYQAAEDVVAGANPPSFNPSQWTPVFDPGAEAPELLQDSAQIVVRLVSTDPRASVSATPTAPCYLTVVDPASWGQPAEEDSAFAYYWEQGNAADVNDPSWGLTADFKDGAFCHATHAGKYYRCRIRLTNSNGFAESISNVIGPLG